ncbi:MAG: TlpA disulfide reductase family protein [Actinomycetota bacterium]
MSDKVIIFVALSVIVMLMVGTATRLSGPQSVPTLTVDRLVKSEPPRPLPSLGQPQGRPAVVAFWASWCTPCARELPTIARFRASAEKAGVSVLTVSVDKDGQPAAERFLAQNNLTGLPMVTDPDNALAKAAGVKGLPTALILNDKGEEVARIEGESDWDAGNALDTVAQLVRPAVEAPVR